MGYVDGGACLTTAVPQRYRGFLQADNNIPSATVEESDC